MDKLLKTLTKFKDKNIAVIGDVMLDHYIYGEVSRISPEAPVPIVVVDKENYFLGGAANTANNIVALGARATLYGVINKEDSAGKMILSLGGKINLCLSHDRRKTTVKTRIIASDQQLIRFDYEDEQKISERVEEEIIISFRKDVKNFNAIAMSDYNKGIFTKRLAKELITLANKHNKPVIIDPKPENIDFFKNCTAICPNHVGAMSITGINYNKNNLKKAAEIIIKKINSRYVVITCGKDGIFVYENDKNSRLIPTYAEEVYDIVGAGDTVKAVLALALSSNANIYESAELANYAAGVVIKKVGTSTTTIEEIKKYIEKRSNKLKY